MYSRTTPNLGLPQWTGKDHPDFLTDMNRAFDLIDRSVGTITPVLETVQQSVSNANQTADAAKQLAESASDMVTTLGDDVTEMQTTLTGVKNVTDKVNPFTLINVPDEQIRPLSIIIYDSDYAQHHIDLVTNFNIRLGFTLGTMQLYMENIGGGVFVENYPNFHHMSMVFADPNPYFREQGGIEIIPTNDYSNNVANAIEVVNFMQESGLGHPIPCALRAYEYSGEIPPNEGNMFFVLDLYPSSPTPANVTKIDIFGGKHNLTLNMRRV